MMTASAPITQCWEILWDGFFIDYLAFGGLPAAQSDSAPTMAVWVLVIFWIEFSEHLDTIHVYIRLSWNHITLNQVSNKPSWQPHSILTRFVDGMSDQVRVFEGKMSDTVIKEISHRTITLTIWKVRLVIWKITIISCVCEIIFDTFIFAKGTISVQQWFRVIVIWYQRIFNGIHVLRLR